MIAYILSLPDDWQIYVSELKNHSTDGKSATASAIKELIKNGYMTRSMVRESGTGKFKGYEYHVFESGTIVENTEDRFSVYGKTRLPITRLPKTSHY